MAQVNFCLIFLLCFGVGSISCKGNTMKKLRADLLKDYDKFVRPAENNKNATTVQLTISFLKLLKLDESRGEIEFDGWIQMYWTDEFLIWNPSEYDGINIIRIPVDDIWKPDVTIYNGKRRMNDNYQEMNALVYNSGSVVWVPSGNFISYCNLMNKQHERTTHTCSIVFGSWTFSGYEIDLQLKVKANLSELWDDNPFWSVTEITSERQNKFYNCCAEPYPSVRFNVTFQQRMTAHDCLSKILRVASQILFLSMFWLPVTHKMLMGSVALFCCAVYAVHTTWSSQTLHPFSLSAVTAEFAVGLAAVIVEIIVINISQPAKTNRPKILNILMTGFDKALSLVHAKETTADPKSIDIVESSNKKNKESAKEDGFCSGDFLFFTKILDRFLFVIFTVIFLIVANYC